MDGSTVGADYTALDITPYNPSIGATVRNIDLTKPLGDIELTELKRAFIEYQVLFFRDQQISHDDHARLAEYFGTIGQHVGKKTNSQASDDPRVRKFYADGEMHLERMSSHTFNSWTRRLFEYAGGELAECTHHSIRRACVKWAARCGASEHDIKRAGRWKTSSERFA